MAIDLFRNSTIAFGQRLGLLSLVDEEIDLIGAAGVSILHS